MLGYILKRILLMIPTLIGDLADLLPHHPASAGRLPHVADGRDGRQRPDRRSGADRRGCASIYGLDQPLWVQYWKWISGIVFHGDFGCSFEWSQPVAGADLGAGMGSRSLISICSAALRLGGVAADRHLFGRAPYSIGDHVFTFFGFIGLAIPNFILALMLMYVSCAISGRASAACSRPSSPTRPGAWPKFVDLLAHLWIPVIVIGTTGTAALIRILRANLLDELNKPYVITARAKGLSESQADLKYPVRIALNPFVSTIGWVLPAARSPARPSPPSC